MSTDTENLQNLASQRTGTRIRVKEFRHINPKELTVNPNNWRIHDNNQREAIKSLLDNIGFAGTIVAYESERNNNKLVVIDGHMRLDEVNSEEVPVVILDVSDDEADILLATYDPVGQMATSDSETLGKLLHNIQSDDANLQTLLTDIDEAFGLIQSQLPEQQTDADYVENEHAERFANDTEEAIIQRQLASESLKPMILYVPAARMEEIREKIRVLGDKFGISDTASLVIKLIDESYEQNK